MSSRLPPPPRPKVVRHFRRDEEEGSSSEEEGEEELYDEAEAENGEEGKDLKSQQLEPPKRGITIQKVQLPKKEPADEVKEEGEEAESSSEGEYVTEEEEDVEEEEKKPVSMPTTKTTEPKKESSEEEEESSSEEEESESESDSPEPPKFARPVFIKKGQRKDSASQTPEPAKVDNHQETLKLVEQSIRNEQMVEAAKFGEDDEIYIVDDTDDLDPAAEKAAWKLRELQRIERERNEMAERERELEENEERRNRTAEEIAAEAEEKQKKEKEEKQKRAKMKFMQKYYHRGAFYQDDDLLKQRDFNEAVEDDYQDKSVLPKPLQVRSGLGLKGQTKYRGLREEDTTLQNPTKKRKPND